jgi:hypothetical protein
VLIARYRLRFDAAGQETGDAAAGVRERLAGYAGQYAEVFTDGGRMAGRPHALSAIQPVGKSREGEGKWHGGSTTASSRR